MKMIKNEDHGLKTCPFCKEGLFVLYTNVAKLYFEKGYDDEAYRLARMIICNFCGFVAHFVGKGEKDEVD